MVAIRVTGLEDIERTLVEFARPGVISRAMGPSLGAMANVVRTHVKRRNFEFTDRFGPRSEGARYRSLRQSIRARRIPGIYGGQRYRTGRAAVFSGGSGARQSHLVHEGHGGPWPARPYRYLRRGVTETTRGQSMAFTDSLERRWPRLARDVSRVGAGRRSVLNLSATGVFARTVARRGRRR